MYKWDTVQYDVLVDENTTTVRSKFQVQANKHVILWLLTKRKQKD